MNKLSLILFAGLLSACSGSKSDSSGGTNAPQGQFKTEAASGLVNGSPWTFTSGFAKQSFFDPSEMAISLSDQNHADPCAVFNLGPRLILARAPIAGASEVQFGQGDPMHTATFSFEDTEDGWMNLVSTNGRMQIASITDNIVTGSIIIHFDGGNSVNGTFSLPLCP